MTTVGLAVQAGDGDVALAPLAATALHPAEEPLVTRGEGATVSAGLLFSLRSPLGGPGVTAAGVIRASDGVLAALETRPGRGDLRLVVGPVAADPLSLDLSLVGLLLERDGALLATAAGAAAHGGHPAGAVAAALAAAPDVMAEAGWIVYSGPLVAPVDVAAGSHARATFAHLGSVGVRLA